LQKNGRKVIFANFDFEDFEKNILGCTFREAEDYCLKSGEKPILVLDNA